MNTNEVVGNNGHLPNKRHGNKQASAVFNKPFCEDSAMFLNLHEIELSFVQTEKNYNDMRTVIYDPRTKTPVENVLYDYTKSEMPLIFPSKRISSMTKSEHEVVLQVLLSIQNRTTIPENEFVAYQKLIPKRNKEMIEAKKFIREYAENRVESINELGRKFTDLYKKWYKNKIANMDVENINFNTYLGLPNINRINNLVSEDTVIVNIELIKQKGCVPIVENTYVNSFNFQQNFHKLSEKYLNDCDDRLNNENDMLSINHINDSDRLNHNNVLIPFESLLILLTIGEYIDLPTEILFKIHANQDGYKTIEFQKPLPARNCGWNTNNKMIKKILEPYLSHTHYFKWWNISEKNVINTSIDEIYAVPHDSIKYNPITFNGFQKAMKYNSFNRGSDAYEKAVALLRWNLKTESKDINVNFFTTLALTPSLNLSGTEFMGSNSIKLEYKSKFGCEVMTKYELLENWLQMRFISSVFPTKYGRCLRISADTFDVQLDERFTLIEIEQQLMDLYEVNVSKLLHNLNEFIGHLCNFGEGNYLLRYNPKFKDKIMLYVTSKDTYSNTINLPNLMQISPTSLVFMSNKNFLPISEKLCSTLHICHRFLPCSFHPISTMQRKNRKRIFDETSIFNDRKEIIKKAKLKHEHKMLQKNLKKNRTKRWKSKRKREINE